jgi:hypothetical protein
MLPVFRSKAKQNHGHRFQEDRNQAFAGRGEHLSGVHEEHHQDEKEHRD